MRHARSEISGRLECTAADRPEEIVGYCMKQTGRSHLGQATQNHPAKAAVLQAGVDMFSVTAPFVDRLTLIAVHAGAPFLQALRFGVAVAFVSRLALWLGSILASRGWAEHLHGGVDL